VNIKVSSSNSSGDDFVKNMMRLRFTALDENIGIEAWVRFSSEKWEELTENEQSILGSRLIAALYEFGEIAREV
jgi:hypothetical protein